MLYLLVNLRAFARNANDKGTKSHTTQREALDLPGGLLVAPEF
jgi:hypothetical protein